MNSARLMLAGALIAALPAPAWAEREESPTDEPSMAPSRRSDAEDNEEEIEHTFVLGIGGAGEIELNDRSFHAGVNLMAEMDAIENWLELELGASVIPADGGVEIPVDLLFKKPFRLSARSELFIGVGPEIVHIRNSSVKATYVGVEFALDFFYWPTQRVGFWIEPSFDISFRDKVSSGPGATGGLVIGW